MTLGEKKRNSPMRLKATKIKCSHGILISTHTSVSVTSRRLSHMKMIDKKKVTRGNLAAPKSQLLILQNAELHMYECASEILWLYLR